MVGARIDRVGIICLSIAVGVDVVTQLGSTRVNIGVIIIAVLRGRAAIAIEVLIGIAEQIAAHGACEKTGNNHAVEEKLHGLQDSRLRGFDTLRPVR
jgi:hypothetical protein